MYSRIIVAGESNKAALAGFLGGLKCFHCASRSEDLVNLLLPLNAMHLPQVQVVCLEIFQRRVQFRLRACLGPLARLGREEDLFSDLIQAETIGLFALAIPIAGSAIKIRN